MPVAVVRVTTMLRTVVRVALSGVTSGPSPTVGVTVSSVVPPAFFSAMDTAAPAASSWRSRPTALTVRSLAQVRVSVADAPLQRQHSPCGLAT